MQKLWQKKLKLDYPKGVFDIVLFGSGVFDIENANDLDFAIIFDKIPLKRQLEISQGIKSQLKKNFDKEIHISSFDYYSLFEAGNFAREGILFYGKSMIKGNDFARVFGLKPTLRIKYDLRSLDKRGKVRFNYLLNGRGGNYGILREYGGEIVAPGVVETKPENEKIFLNRIEKITSDYRIEKIFSLDN